MLRTGIERAAPRALFKAMGYIDEEIYRPLVGVANSWNEIVPGHIQLDRIAEAVKTGVRIAGGTPMEFGVIGVCDGLAMGHEGMKYSLVTRELIADSIECMAKAHAFDALVLIPNCDKIIPGMLMAAARVNIPTIVVSGGPMLAGRWKGKNISVTQMFEGAGMVLSGKITEAELSEMEEQRLPRLRKLRGDVHRQLHELPHRGPGNGPARQRHYSGCPCGSHQAGKEGRNQDNGASGKGHQAARYYDRGRVQKRPGRGHGAGLFDQHRPACPGDRARGEGRFQSGYAQRGECEDPHLVTISPAIAHPSDDPAKQETHHIQDLDEAGGVPAVMKELGRKGLIDMSVMTATGETLGENLARVCPSRTRT